VNLDDEGDGADGFNDGKHFLKLVVVLSSFAAKNAAQDDKHWRIGECHRTLRTFGSRLRSFSENRGPDANAG
jgi:hypothetical protein